MIALAIAAFDDGSDAGVAGSDAVHGQALPGVEPAIGVQGQRTQPLADHEIVTQLLAGILAVPDFRAQTILVQRQIGDRRVGAGTGQQLGG